MDYSITYSEIMAIVEEEVSREAGQAYSADGVSLYDGIRMVSRDESKKKRLMGEALVLLGENLNRFIFVKETEPSEPAEPEDTPESSDPEAQSELTKPEEGDVVVDEPSLEFHLDTTSRRFGGKSTMLSSLFQNIAVYFVMNRFFLSKNQTDLASKYEALALADVQTLNRLLYTKLPPKYPKINTNKDEQDSENNPA